MRGKYILSNNLLKRNPFFSKIDVQVVTTDHATHFYEVAEVPVRVYTDQDEWKVSMLGVLTSNAADH